MTGEARQRRILVVEDEPVNRALLRAVIRSAPSLGGPLLDEAATLADARRLLRESPPDVVILDVRLPDGSGLELAGDLPPAGADRPRVIVMSASVLPADRAKALAAGGDAFLGKPFLPRDLIALLEGVARDR